MNSIAAIVLAAGSSSRLGQPKQLLKVRGKSLVGIAVENCLNSGIDRAIVVLGFNNEAVVEVLRDYPVKTLVNQNWEKGMGHSLSFGLNHLTSLWPDIDGLLIQLCDQPFIPESHFVKLIHLFLKGEKSIIASLYKDTFGPPLICDKRYFPELEKLDGDKGAKSIFQKYKEELYLEPCPECAADIDKPEDLELIRKKSG